MAYLNPPPKQFNLGIFQLHTRPSGAHLVFCSSLEFALLISAIPDVPLESCFSAKRCTESKRNFYKMYFIIILLNNSVDFIFLFFSSRNCIEGKTFWLVLEVAGINTKDNASLFSLLTPWSHSDGKEHCENELVYKEVHVCWKFLFTECTAKFNSSLHLLLSPKGDLQIP